MTRRRSVWKGKKQKQTKSPDQKSPVIIKTVILNCLKWFILLSDMEILLQSPNASKYISVKHKKALKLINFTITIERYENKNRTNF